MKKLLLFLLISNSLFCQWSISNADRGTLISIYNTTGGEKWNRTWDLQTDPRNWFGVTVKNGVITELNLSGNALAGSFPSSITSLTKLKKLDLSNNQLSGDVTNLSSISSLTRLDISNNNLTGDPTASLSGLSNVEDLALGGNHFVINDVDGLLQNFNDIKSLNLADLQLKSLPSRLATFINLKELILDNDPIDADNLGGLASLSNLQSLSLSGVGLAQIPSSLSNLKYLKILNFCRNNFNTKNAFSLSNVKNLEWLSLENNLLTEVPQELEQLTKLKHLNLGRNIISRDLSSLSKLPDLQQLFLNNNKLSGTFPSILASMPKLLMLNLNSNQLSGNLPARLPNIVNICNNRFTKEQLISHIKADPEQTEFLYSPQRYDDAKLVSGVIGQYAKLDQSLSEDDYTFNWYKNLDQKTNVTSSTYSINSVKSSDFAMYTAEATTTILLFDNFVFDLSLFREPIELVEKLDTAESKKDFSIYPNPTSDYLYISNSRYPIQNVQIYDLSGKQIPTNSISKIDVSHLPSGVYLLAIKTQEGISHFKFIKK